MLAPNEDHGLSLELQLIGGQLVGRRSRLHEDPLLGVKIQVSRWNDKINCAFLSSFCSTLARRIGRQMATRIDFHFIVWL